MHFLSGIGLKQVKKAPLAAVDTIFVNLETGMEGDVRGSGGRDHRRQVTAIALNQWMEACTELGIDPSEYSWMLRRAGICIGGMVFTPKHIGQFIGIGEDLVLEITGEIEPCERMNEVFPGLKDVLAIHMRCGVTCRVIVPGSISIWDAVAIHPHYPI